jgi:hypothetical protein
MANVSLQVQWQRKLIMEWIRHLLACTFEQAKESTLAEFKVKVKGM